MKYKSLEEGLTIIENTIKVGIQSKDLQWSDTMQNMYFPKRECLDRILHKATQQSHKHIAWANHADFDMFDSVFWVLTYERMQEYCLNEFGVEYPLTWFMCLKLSAKADKVNPTWFLHSLYERTDENGFLNDMWYAALVEGKEAGLLSDAVIESTISPSPATLGMTEHASDMLNKMASVMDLSIDELIESKWGDYDMVLPHENDDSHEGE